ncbi:MAG: hypothetical protein NTZ26_02160 [Candidatus Aminicenantes bacterium]|nr:hypothetical protein [Candidatus Aminicenantes bacterium]
MATIEIFPRRSNKIVRNSDKKNGLLARLTGRSKPKKSPCCGGMVIEEVPEEKKEDKNNEQAPKDKKPCCCG